MKVLFVTNMYPSPERPGYGSFVGQQAEQLRRFGHVVDVVNILGFRSKVNYVKGALEVLRRTLKTSYDIVHAHYGLSLFAACFRLQSPLVITLHGSDVLGTRFEYLCSRVLSRFADAVIVVSEEMRRRIPGIVIPCGVDLNVFKPYDRDEARTRLGWPKNKRLVLFPFDPARRVKRYDLAKAAVDQLVMEGVDAELVAVFAAENNEMPWYYSAADAMILCSNSEGSPTSVKEALACNLPVVATDVGDLQEVFQGVAGTQICRLEVREISSNLREVLGMPRSSVNGRTAMARYDQAGTVQRIVGVYNDVLHRVGAKAQRRLERARQQRDTQT